ncbi:serine threonine protein kinase [Pyrenophora tritici-repentis]|nr:serine threonine protein kinase [Pyrenophora tritici-repentis]
MAAPLTYADLDHNDCHFFDHILANDSERVAFIRFFEHVERKDSQQKRPRTGTGRVKLWRRSSRAHWVHRAEDSQPFPEILRPTWIPPVAGGTPAVPVPSSQPVASPPQVLTLVAPIASGSISIAPVDVPASRSLDLAFGSIVETVLQVPTSPDVQKRKRDINTLVDDEQPSIGKKAKVGVYSTDVEHPASSHFTDIGGEKCPQFVLYNEVEMKNKKDSYKALAPSKEQCRFVQEALEGGVPDVSTFLFAKINDDRVIEDRAVIKCTDISTKNNPSHGQVEREATAANALRATNCRHVQQSIEIQKGLEKQNLNFRVELLDDHPSWKLNYQASGYASHGTLRTLIKNHESAKQPIPEHFCWFVFGAIVHALITCQTEYCSEAQPTPIDAGSLRPDWRRMLHLDINPDNIFLSGPDPNFDAALCLDPDPANHKAQFDSVRFKGKRYWQAPEKCMQYAKSGQYPPSRWELDHATDIYSLGLEADNFDKESKIPPNFPEYEFPSAKYPHSAKYSPALMQTVQYCLAFRPRYDPHDPEKKFRPPLFRLRDDINENLAKMDAKFTAKIEEVQARPGHKKRTIFSDEDTQFAIGAKMPPVPLVNMADLTDAKAIDRDKKKALETWEAYLVNAGRKPISMDASIVSAALNDVFQKFRESFTEKIGKEKQEKRRLYFNALDHSMNTFQKCINPSDKFKQLRGQYDPEFFLPRNKCIVLNQIQGNSKIVRREVRQALQKISEEQNDIEDKLRQAKDDLELAKSAHDQDEDIIKTLTSLYQQSQERQEFKSGHATALQDKISVLTVLCEAANVGFSILIFGNELWPEEDVIEEREHWFPKLSLVHRCVWEYFWARPDGVFVDKVDDGGNELEDLIMQGLSE